MSTAHTPAPWYISTADGSGDSLYVGGMVLQSPRTAFKHRSSLPDALAEIDRETLLANAYLIAAAPELLQMVIDLLDALGEGDSEIENDARDLIAKATGVAA